MKMFASDPMAPPLPIPDSTSLATQLAQQLGMQVVVTIENQAHVGAYLLYLVVLTCSVTLTVADVEGMDRREHERSRLVTCSTIFVNL